MSESNTENTRLEELQGEEITAAAMALAKAHAGSKNSWAAAKRMVYDFRPVAGYLWRIVHAVLGQTEKLGKPDPIAFDTMTPLLRVASGDLVLTGTQTEAESRDEAIKKIGFDTAAAICVIHGVCRRVGAAAPERIWRPIIDDALLRANIGFLIGGQISHFGKGRGLLAGFCGRAGLAVQIAASDLNRSQKALEGLAAGMDIRVVGLNNFGCDPLQVSAIMLASAGVSTEAALGVAAFSNDGRGLTPKGMQQLWYAVFVITEHLRMNEPERIDPKHWRTIGYDDLLRKELEVKVKSLLKKGHRWDWVCEPQLILEEELKALGGGNAL